MPSTATDSGWLNTAEVAGPPFPLAIPAVPGVPANRLITPVEAVSFQTALACESAMYRFPALSKANPYGVSSAALNAGPPEPDWLCTPLPAIVLMIAVGGVVMVYAAVAGALTAYPGATAIALRVAVPVTSIAPWY